MDIGVGTGYYPAHTVYKLSKCRQVILADLNPNTLRMATDRLKAAGYTGEKPNILVHDIFKPLPATLKGTVDSVSLFYVFHCLPGTLPEKAECVAEQLAPVLSSDGTFYGCTVVGQGVEHNWIGKMLMKIYHKKGIFCNYGDSAAGLKKGLAVHFEDVDVRVVGRVALFVARKPVSCSYYTSQVHPH